MFEKTSLKNKLIGLIVLVVIGFVIIALAYIASINLRDTAKGEFENVLKFGEKIDQISIQMLQARRSEKDFILRSNEKYLGKHEKVIRQTLDTVSEIENLLVNDEQQTQLTTLRTQINAYQKGFLGLAQNMKETGLTPKTGLRGSLREAVHNVEQIVNDASQLKLSVSMLMMRRHEKDYLARKDDKYAGKMIEEGKKFNALLKGKGLKPKERKLLQEGIKVYQDDFALLVENASEASVIQQAFRNDVHAMEDTLGEMRAVVPDMLVENKAQFESEAAIANMMFVTALISIAVIVAAILLLL